jgi:hypothetical protein
MTPSATSVVSMRMLANSAVAATWASPDCRQGPMSSSLLHEAGRAMPDRAVWKSVGAGLAMAPA